MRIRGQETIDGTVGPAETKAGRGPKEKAAKVSMVAFRTGGVPHVAAGGHFSTPGRVVDGSRAAAFTQQPQSPSKSPHPQSSSCSSVSTLTAITRSSSAIARFALPSVVERVLQGLGFDQQFAAGA